MQLVTKEGFYGIRPLCDECETMCDSVAEIDCMNLDCDRPAWICLACLKQAVRLFGGD